MKENEMITQLEDLIKDRKSFLSGEKENDKIFLDDICALKMAISTIQTKTAENKRLRRELREWEEMDADDLGEMLAGM